MNDNFEAILRLTRAGVLRGPLCPNEGSRALFGRIDWTEVYRLAGRCGVTAMTAGVLSDLPADLRPPLQIRLSWEMSAQKCREEFNARHKAACSLRKVLQKAGCTRVLMLKGETLAALYPDPSGRASSDLDIMPLDHYDESNRAVEALGIDVDYSHSKHSGFRFEGQEVENHTPSPDWASRRNEYRTAELIGKAAASGKLQEGPCGYQELDPVTAAIHTLSHFAMHILLNEEVTLRMALDLELLLRRYPSVPDEWKDGLRYTGLEPFAAVMLCMLDKLFGEGREPRVVATKKRARDARSIINLYILDRGSRIQRLLVKYRYLPLSACESISLLSQKLLRRIRR